MFQRILITLTCLFAAACLAETDAESTQSAALTDKLGEPAGDIDPASDVSSDSFDGSFDSYGDIPDLQLEKAGCRQIQRCSFGGKITRAGVEFTSVTCRTCTECCLPNPWGGESCTVGNCGPSRDVLR